MNNLWLFDKRRLEILDKLLKCSSIAGCDLRSNLKMKKPLLSYHIDILKKKGFIEETKTGREKQYRIKKAKIPVVKKIIKLIQK